MTPFSGERGYQEVHERVMKHVSISDVSGIFPRQEGLSYLTRICLGYMMIVAAVW